MALNTIGSISIHIVESLSVPTGISGNMVEIVDMARQHVSNYTGQDIGSNSIDAKYQPAIVNLAKADTIDFISANEDAGNVRLDELTVGDSDTKVVSQAYRDMAENYLKSLGRGYGTFKKTLV